MIRDYDAAPAEPQCEPICIVSLPLGLGFGLVKAKDALLLKIASFISCHKLAGVALARCSWRSVKNDPPTAERAAHVVVEPIGGLGKPRHWGYSR